jgi:formylmethanofuran dehydrogenase subunit B
VPLEKAIERAADILANSHAPLIWGLSHSSTAGQRAAIALAEQLGATIDTTASCQPAPTLALQKVGQSTCTLGEVRNRADLVIFWRTDPLTTHPRHLERYSVDPQGMFVPGGRAERKVIVLDTHATKTSDRADEFIPITSSSELPLIDALRTLARGEKLSDASTIGNVPIAEIQQLAEQMKSCRYGALFFGVGQGSANENRAVVEGLFELTRELNQSTRFTAHYIPSSGGLTGAENVLCWQTGLPFAVNYAEGYPRFDPDQFSANRLLENGTADACLLVGSEEVPKLSPRAQERLAAIPTISLDNAATDPTTNAAVQFSTAIYGIHAPGTAYRMDGVPIPLRSIMNSTYPTEDEVLTAITNRVRERSAVAN